MRALDTAILIGSFEPLHAGHLTALEAAMNAAGHVLLLIGSARAARSIRHPWTTNEREEMIRACLDAPTLASMTIASLRDRLYDDASWAAGVRQVVSDAIDSTRRVGLVAAPWSGEFPEWPPIRVAPLQATPTAELRQRYLTGSPLGPDIPAGARDVLVRLRAAPSFAALIEEYQAVQAHREAWSVAPYPPVLVTVDAVVVQSGHVLLIRRGRQPGRGLWALPGGFVDPAETLLAACLRELREETRLALPDATLLASLRGQRVFDAPDRSLRGRTITHGFHFALPDAPLPGVAGSDDAERAEWVPLPRFLELEDQMFEDHYHIVRLFIG